MLLPSLLVLAVAVPPGPQDGERDGEVPVTIREIDLAEAIREFQAFRERLGTFQEELGAGRVIAEETAQILEELRRTAGPENDWNEDEILRAVAGYVDQVVQKQVELVDFLESQRYRISYYANKMAASVRSEDLELVFGTVESSEAAIESRARGVSAARRELADFVDSLPADQLDKESFRPLPGMPEETRRRLDAALYRYQQERDALELAKKRLQVVRAAQRTGGAEAPDVDADLLVGQMFGALDRIRLQMSMDLLALEHLLGSYARSSRTQEILASFQDLIELQGDLEGPSPELSSVLDWLQDSSIRRLSIASGELSGPGLRVDRASDLLREAYVGARGEAIEK